MEHRRFQSHTRAINASGIQYWSPRYVRAVSKSKIVGRGGNNMWWFSLLQSPTEPLPFTTLVDVQGKAQQTAPTAQGLRSSAAW